jgi:hypothetical protein
VIGKRASDGMRQVPPVQLVGGSPAVMTGQGLNTVPTPQV